MPPLVPQITTLKTRLFRCFADTSRLLILEALREGSLTVGAIVAKTGLSQLNVSNHLRCLSDCDLVVSQSQGRSTLYQLSNPKVTALLKLAEEVLRDSARDVYECTHSIEDGSPLAEKEPGMSKATPDAPRTIELPIKGMDGAEWSQHVHALPARGWCTPRTSLVVWAGQAISVGIGQSFTLHRHYATQISISLGAPLQVRTHASGPYTEQQSFIVGPNIPHQVKGEGVPYFALWSENRALAELARRLSTTSASELPALPENLLNALLPVLLASGGQLPDAQAGQALLSHVLTTLIGPTWDEGPNDPRIATARSLITPQFLVEQSQPITFLATFVHLSPSRFRHLFHSEMGMSVQSYLRWKRLMAALYTSAHGASLTQAAHAAGFADSAHLTRVFRATFGMQPSRIFKNSHVVQIIPGAER